MTTKRLQTATDLFRKLRELDAYIVDKSLLIKAVLEGSEVILMPRPRRFGKTTNMSMMAEFFDRRKTDQDWLFEGMKILQEGPEILKHKGAHPVIFMTLKGWKYDNIKDLTVAMSEALSTLYEQHDEIVPFLKPMQKEDYLAVLHRRATLSQLENSLKNLSLWLSQVHGAKTFIFIDEYDAPIIHAWSEGFYPETIKLFRLWLGEALKTSESLGKAVLTGILRIAKENLFSGLNNLSVSSVIKPLSYGEFFGFTQEEVEKLLTDFGKADHIDEARRWYNGYTFGKAIIYNPWSMSHFASDPDSEFQAHWVNTSDNQLVFDSIDIHNDKVRQSLQDILENKEVLIALREDTVFADIALSPETLWSFLVHTGYLKAMPEGKNSRDEAVWTLSLPNEELRSIFGKLVDRALWKPSYNGLVDVLDAIIYDDPTKLETELNEMFAQILSVHDVAKFPEAFIHGFFLALAATLGNRYFVESNREAGGGRADLILIPRHPSAYGVPKVFEFKSIKPRAKAQPAIDEALEQIQTKDYAARCRAAGFDSFLAFALVQQGKKLHIRQG
jgi:Predicted AAA-ATPase/PD-(D/E)XK nuclease superfamily